MAGIRVTCALLLALGAALAAAQQRPPVLPVAYECDYFSTITEEGSPPSRPNGRIWSDYDLQAFRQDTQTDIILVKTLIRYDLNRTYSVIRNDCTQLPYSRPMPPPDWMLAADFVFYDGVIDVNGRACNAFSIRDEEFTLNQLYQYFFDVTTNELVRFYADDRTGSTTTDYFNYKYAPVNPADIAVPPECEARPTIPLARKN